MPAGIVLVLDVAEALDAEEVVCRANCAVIVAVVAAVAVVAEDTASTRSTTACGYLRSVNR